MTEINLTELQDIIAELAGRYYLYKHRNEPESIPITEDGFLIDIRYLGYLLMKFGKCDIEQIDDERYKIIYEME